MTRSCQQDALYAAERTIAEGETFESLHHVQRFVDELRDTWWWMRWCPEVLRVEVGPARKNATFAGVGWYERAKCAGRMEFSTCRPSMRLVVHELAHVIASARRESAAHDPWFARIYVELTYLIMGTTAYHDLQLAFVAGEVDYDAAGLAAWERKR